MNKFHPIPALNLPESVVADIAQLRAEGLSWSALADELDLPPESRPDLDLLPFFHPQWHSVYPAAARQCEQDTFLEAQLMTRQMLQRGKKEAHIAARKRVVVRPPLQRGDDVAPSAPLVVITGSALAFRLARGESLESIAAAYRVGIRDETGHATEEE